MDLWYQVITLCGPFQVSRRLAIRDDPKDPVKMLDKRLKFNCFTHENTRLTTTPSPPPLLHRVSTQHVPVCGRVVPVHTGTFCTYTRGRVECNGFFSACHTPHTTPHTPQHRTHTTKHRNNNHHHNNTRRQRQRETEKERER